MKKLITLLPTKGKSPKQILKEAEKHLEEKGYLKEKEEVKEEQLLKERLKELMEKIEPTVTKADIEFGRMACDAIVESLRSLGNDKKSKNKSMK